jgi:hypothetical protein
MQFLVDWVLYLGLVVLGADCTGLEEDRRSEVMLHVNIAMSKKDPSPNLFILRKVACV